MKEKLALLIIMVLPILGFGQDRLKGEYTSLIVSGIVIESIHFKRKYQFEYHFGNSKWAGNYEFSEDSLFLKLIKNPLASENYSKISNQEPSINENSIVKITVLDENDQKIPFAKILCKIKDSIVSNKTTNFEGSVIDTIPKNSIIEISWSGFKTFKIPVVNNINYSMRVNLERGLLFDPKRHTKSLDYKIISLNKREIILERTNNNGDKDTTIFRK